MEFRYDAASFTATWTLDQPLRADRFQVVLSESVVDISGIGLDANFVDGVSSFPSGDGIIEQLEQFQFRLHVVPGDFDGGTLADRRDVMQVLQRIASAAGEAAYDVRADLDGDARIAFSDLRAAVTSLGGGLPVDPPTVGGSEPIPRSDKKTKGSTKTASPRRGFKKRK